MPSHIESQNKDAELLALLATAASVTTNQAFAIARAIGNLRDEQQEPLLAILQDKVVSIQAA